MFPRPALFLSFALLVIFCPASRAEEIDIGSRLELFVDDLLIERMTGGLICFDGQCKRRFRLV